MTMRVANIMEMRVAKTSPQTIFYKNSHCSAEYNSKTMKNKKNINVAQLSEKRLKLSAGKYEDLLLLCIGNLCVIRKSEYAKFYENPVKNSKSG